MVYGLVVPDEPIFVPSRRNCTLAMPEPVSEFVAVRVTEEPETVAPFDGAVRETEGAVVSTTMVLLAARFKAGVKLVMALPSVEVMEPDTDETLRGLAFCPPPTVYVQEALVELDMPENVQVPPVFRVTVTVPAVFTALEKVRSISMAEPCLYAPFSTIEVMLEMMGAVVFQGGMVIPVLLVARTLPRVSATVPFPEWAYVTTTPAAPAPVMEAVVRTTLVLSEPGAIDETA